MPDMYLQFFEPHPALKEIVNNIMISQIDFDPSQPKPSFPFPPLPEQCLFFYPYDGMEVEHLSGKGKEKQSSSIVVGPQTERLTITMGYLIWLLKLAFNPVDYIDYWVFPCKSYCVPKPLRQVTC